MLAYNHERIPVKVRKVKSQSNLQLPRRSLTKPFMTGSEMKDLRNKLGWSQQKLATALGLSVSAISHYEQGKVRSKSGERRVTIPPVVELACEMLLVKRERGEI